MTELITLGYSPGDTIVARVEAQNGEGYSTPSPDSTGSEVA